MQKVATVKETRGKGEEKGKKKVWNGQWPKKSQKKSKFWLMRMHQTKIFHIFAPNLGEIYQFGQK